MACISSCHIEITRKLDAALLKKKYTIPKMGLYSCTMYTHQHITYRHLGKRGRAICDVAIRSTHPRVLSYSTGIGNMYRKNGWPLDRSTLYTAVTEVCRHIVDECISCDTTCVHLLITLLVIYCYSCSILMLIRCLREHRQVVILVDCI